MLTIRRAEERGHFDHGWLDTKHTFSFGRYYDEAWTGFGALRVINDDIVAPGAGFGEHPHRNMEIVTWVLEGALAHGDSLGNAKTLRPGWAQAMTAGRGIRHSEFNGSKKEPVRLLQIWIEPREEGTEPRHEDREFPAAKRTDALCLIASGDGADGSLEIGQDARVYVGTIGEGVEVKAGLGEGRRGWVQVARGSARVNGEALAEGDGVGLEREAEIVVRGGMGGAEVMVFDVP